MKQHIRITAMVFLVSLFTLQNALAAPMLNKATPAFAKSASIKLISFHVRNDSGTAMTIKAGDQELTVNPGETTSLKLQEGAQVTAVNATTHFSPGQVVTTVSDVLQGNTLVLL